MLHGEESKISFIDFDLTWPRLKHMTYHTWGKHITDAIWNASEIYLESNAWSMLYGETTLSPLVSWNKNTFKIFNINPILLLRSGHTIRFSIRFFLSTKIIFHEHKSQIDWNVGLCEHLAIWITCATDAESFGIRM